MPRGSGKGHAGPKSYLPSSGHTCQPEDQALCWRPCSRKTPSKEKWNTAVEGPLPAAPGSSILWIVGELSAFQTAGWTAVPITMSMRSLSGADFLHVGIHWFSPQSWGLDGKDFKIRIQKWGLVLTLQLWAQMCAHVCLFSGFVQLWYCSCPWEEALGIYLVHWEMYFTKLVVVPWTMPTYWMICMWGIQVTHRCH